MSAGTKGNTGSRTRSMLFYGGDCFFLILVGSMGAVVMRQMHEWLAAFAAAMIAGMVLAMVIQMSLALAAAPLLGSIESMTPSMVVAMLSPMVVCVCHMAGCELSRRAALTLGLVFGTVMYVLLLFYGKLYRRRLHRFFPAT